MTDHLAHNRKPTPEKGSKFGFLTVIRELDKHERPKYDKRFFELLCDCGKITIMEIYSFTNSKRPSASCGCKRSKQTATYFEEEFKKIIGQKFNRLTVLGTFRVDHGRRYIDCECECGNRICALMSNVISGKSRSCGCYHKEITASTQVWEVEMRQYIRKSVAVRKLEFNLTLDQFQALCLQNCTYCGLPPDIKTAVGGKLRNGIDRKDSSIGYEIDNCVPCCKICNRAKLTMPQSEFLEWIGRLRNFKLPKE